ncbi:MAG: MBOAT family protein [Bacteroidetes bacterium]|nr:MAG: MBOAT family protein [Bacteroidota bacterium]RLD86404.1 MAG: MBOAT family protein [Bacteroidota bacterium]
MLFNSWQYIFFFFIIFLTYFSLPYRYRSILLLVGSYIFYMAWKWEFAFLMLAITFVNYWSGYKIARTNNKLHKKLWLAFALMFSLGTLVYFKYANFFIDNFITLLQQLGINNNISYLHVILPVGISFYTFQALSYSLDIYRNKTEVENSPVNFAVYVAFFPQLVAGPIERSTHLLKQFKEKHHFNSENLIEGSKMFIWGLFKKVVIADRLGIYVDNVYASPNGHSGATLALATFFFAIQIYCDFSGYSDMAIGSARILGFRIMQNFNLPYLASSISNFWKRWHISLSTWFADYLYIPLGGNRVSIYRWIFNIFFVFIVSGFWHGANWTFIIWGALHAFYYLVEYIGDQSLKQASLQSLKNTSFYRLFKIASVFLFVCYAWIFFRAESTHDAFHISEMILTDLNSSVYLGASTVSFVLSIALILFLFIVQILQYNGIASIYFSKPRVPAALQFTYYVFLLTGISLLGISSNAFIYFQF